MFVLYRSLFSSRRKAPNCKQGAVEALSVPDFRWAGPADLGLQIHDPLPRQFHPGVG